MSILWEPDNLAEFKEVQLPLYPEYKLWADTGFYEDLEEVPCPILPCGNNTYLLPAGTPIGVWPGLITDVEDEADAPENAWWIGGEENVVVAEDYYFYLNQAAARQNVKLLIHGYVDESRIPETYLDVLGFAKQTIDDVKASLAENQIFLVAPGGMASGGGSGGGSGSGPLVVTLSGDEQTADKTFREIEEALSSGRGANVVDENAGIYGIMMKAGPGYCAYLYTSGVKVSIKSSANEDASEDDYPIFSEGEDLADV